MREIKRKKQQIHDKILQLRKRGKQVSAELQALDVQHDQVVGQIGKISTDLNKKQHDKRALEADLAALSAQLSEKKSALAERAVVLYKQGDFSYVELLFQAADFSDFIDRLFYIQLVFKHDRDMIAGIKADQQKVEIKRTEVDQKINEISQMRQQKASEEQRIRAIQTDKQATLEAVNKDKESYEKAERELEQESKSIQQMLQHPTWSYRGAPWSGPFRKPVAGPIMSGFGYRRHPIFGSVRMHTGVDIGAHYGTPVHAGGRGQVVFTGRRGGYGKCVIIDHGKGIATLYGHLSSISCYTGQIVQAGQVIGLVGSTGYSTGPHLHFEVRVNGEPVNPLGRLR